MKAVLTTAFLLFSSVGYAHDAVQVTENACLYRGLAYSNGAYINTGGETRVCGGSGSKGSPYWRLPKGATENSVCIYDDSEYSNGAVVEGQTCMNGAWEN